MRRFLTRSVRSLGALVALAVTGWGALALAVVGPGGDQGRLVLAAVYGLAGLAADVALVLHRGQRFALPVFAPALVAIGVWWSALTPSNERDWQPEVATLAYATINGDMVTVHNIRNFDYPHGDRLHPRVLRSHLRPEDARFGTSWPCTGWGPAIALTTNWTTAILMNTRVNPESFPLSWKVLGGGYTRAYVYESGRMDRSLPFEELQRRSLVNAAAQAADQAPDFSRRIRAGLPGTGGR